MNSNLRKTLAKVFDKPTPKAMPWQDVVQLLVGLGAEMKEGRGSRVCFKLADETLVVHKPHPGKDAHPAMIRDVQKFLENAGYGPGQRG